MNPIKSVEWLYENQNNPNLIVLEASLQTTVNPTYSIVGLHIPNAIPFDISNVFSDASNPLPNMVPSENQFTNEAQKLGINSDSLIVVYDTIGIYVSPRAWWLFLTMNHKNVFVLDGGLPEWIRKGYSTSTSLKTPTLIGNFKAVFQKDYIANQLDIVTNLESKTNLVIDARSPDRFSGQTPDSRKNARSGRIPNSKNIPYETVLNENTLKPKKELELLFEGYFTENKPLIFSCGSGITACIDALAATVAGQQNIRIYDGSWSEWGISDHLPIERD